MPVEHTTIPSADKAPGAPISTTLINALDNNVQAAFEGTAPFKLGSAGLDIVTEGALATLAGSTALLPKGVYSVQGYYGAGGYWCGPQYKIDGTWEDLAGEGTHTVVADGQRARISANNTCSVKYRKLI